MNQKQKLTTKQMVTAALFGAITIILGQTPLGFIPIGPLSATTMHIPVIIAAILEGPLVGGIVGAIFGLTSLLNALIRPTAISPLFYNPLVSIVPRIIIGFAPYFIYRALNKIEDKNLKTYANVLWAIIIVFILYGLTKSVQGGTFSLNLALNIVYLILALGLCYLMNKKLKVGSGAAMITAFLSTILHSLLVMSAIYFLYAEKYLAGVGIQTENAAKVIYTVVLTSGIPEAILATIITTGVVAAVKNKK